MAWKNISVVFLITLLFTAASVISINQYRYGISDQTITIPFIKSILNPALYPGDHVLGQKAYYYTFFWEFCTWAIRLAGTSVPVFFFAFYSACIFFSFLALYCIALTLFQNRTVAFLSLFFLVFSHRTFAGSSTIENLLLTKTAALPFLLFAMYCVLNSRPLAAGALLGVSFLIHPMSSVYVASMIFFSWLLNAKQAGAKRILAATGLFVLTASPILLWKLQHTPVSQHFLKADAEWLELLHLRSPHHIFPSAWDSNIFVQALLIAGLLFISIKHKPAQKHHRIIFHFVVAVFLLCAAGTLFTEVFPVAIIINLQLLRSYTFIWYIALIYFANYFLAEMKAGKSFFCRAGILLVSAAAFYGSSGWKYPFGAFLLIFPGMIVYEWQTRRKGAIEKYFTVAVTVVVVLISTGIFFKKKFTGIGVAASESWLDAQRWAKRNTSTDDVFIVPPQSDGFRIESERTIYGDWKDGTLMNFNPEFGKEWFRRMKNLGYEEISGGRKFRELNREDILKIVSEIKSGERYPYRKIFFISISSSEIFPFPVGYENKDYRIYVVG
jgi:hypothetical protein